MTDIQATDFSYAPGWNPLPVPEISLEAERALLLTILPLASWSLSPSWWEVNLRSETLRCGTVSDQALAYGRDREGQRKESPN